MKAKIRAHVVKNLVQNKEKSLLQFVRDLYVTDSVICFNDLTKAAKFYHLTKRILASREFNFREWETNNLVLRDIISLEKTVNDVQNEKADEQHTLNRTWILTVTNLERCYG